MQCKVLIAANGKGKGKKGPCCMAYDNTLRDMCCVKALLRHKIPQVSEGGEGSG